MKKQDDLSVGFMAGMSVCLMVVFFLWGAIALPGLSENQREYACKHIQLYADDDYHLRWVEKVGGRRFSGRCELEVQNGVWIPLDEVVYDESK